MIINQTRSRLTGQNSFNPKQASLFFDICQRFVRDSSRRFDPELLQEILELPAILLCELEGAIQRTIEERVRFLKFELLLQSGLEEILGILDIERKDFPEKLMQVCRKFLLDHKELRFNIEVFPTKLSHGMMEPDLYELYYQMWGLDPVHPAVVLDVLAETDCFRKTVVATFWEDFMIVFYGCDEICLYPKKVVIDDEIVTHYFFGLRK